MNRNYKTTRLFLHVLAWIAALLPLQVAATDYVPRDVVWTTQSRNSSESMPCGGHDIGMNVWVEQGDLLFYVQQSGWFDENNTLLKAGRWRLHIDDKPFDGSDFEQRLCLDNGAVYIKGGGVEVRLWADVEEPVIYVSIVSQLTKTATLSYESWRYHDRPVTKAECQQCSYKWIVPKDCMTFADSIDVHQDHLVFSHKNRTTTVFDFTIQRERLDAVKDRLYNPLDGLLMQGEMKATGFQFTDVSKGVYASTDYQSWNFRNDHLRNSVLTIQLNTQSVADAATSRERSARWWHQYWQRSWIVTDHPEAQTMVRNYELMRYMLGCNAYGQWPTKFNGGLFTFDPVYVDSTATFTPDYRKWGGGTMTAQNQRLVYWPLLKSGDTDMMAAQLDTYLRMLPTAEAWARQHWGHGGACFSEQIENSGLPNPAEYGKHADESDWGVENNRWLEYEWDTVLEFAMMGLLTDAPRYDELARQCLRFFDEHYQWEARQRGENVLDENGHLVIYPGSGCETYKMARNPASTIAALRTVATALGDTTLLRRLPQIPLTVSTEGDTCIAPAESWERIQNVETPQLYPVWPWRIYGLGRPGLDIALNTYWKDTHAVDMRSSKGWKQDNIWAACLGLTDEACRLNIEKLADGPYRFPAFFDPGFDWAPDHNRGGAGMVGLQEMLLQETPDGQLLFFPAWPREWNCRFRLHTTDGRTVEASLVDGMITTAQARPVIIKTLGNYQTEPMAIVETDRKIRVGWQYQDELSAIAMQEAYQIVVETFNDGHIVYDSGIVHSDQSQFIELPLSAGQCYRWRVRIVCRGVLSDWSDWQTIWSAPSDLGTTARWIGAVSKADARIPQGRWSNTVFKKDTFKTKWADVDTLSMRSIILRREFKAKKQIAHAVVYVSGLGHYLLKVNGQQVGDSEFAPLWSEYSRTVYFNTFDITDLLHEGGNALTVLLGNGFFNVQRGNRYSKLQTSFGPPQLLLRLDLRYADGTTERIVTDRSWLWSPSPVTFNSIYGGESYDARLEQPGCCLPGFRAKGWQNAVVVEGPDGVLRPETCQPVKVMEHYDVKLWTNVHNDTPHAVVVCDMGQNLSGFPEITVSGNCGQKVKLFVSERLTPEGTCDQSQSGRPHYYEYTLKGDGQETWHPHFSYYGFRYIQVEGAVMEGQPNPDGLPVLHSLRSCFVYNSAAETSSFWCNNDLFTRTHRLIERAERSNMQAVMTDCPHREKLGWLEQDHLCGPSLLYNYDMTRLIPKMIRDITDSQKADGMVPTTAPQYVSFGNLFDDSPEWGSTLIILPFQYYDMYGDSTLIVDNYEPMRRYVDYLTSRSDSGIVSHGLGDWYDYGPWRAGFSRNTPVPLVATAHYIYDLQLICEAARMTGHTADECRYRQLYHEVVSSFNRYFYKSDSCYYGTGSQTSNALPLFLGICGDHKEAVLQSLVNDIHAHGDRLTTGDVGNRYLFRVLADNGQNDLLFKMLNHYDSPGYGFQLVQGATTLTEQWDSRQGSSENHFMMGQIDEWLFRSISGIQQQPGTHGMRQLLINPQSVGDITRVKTTIHTLYGEVKVAYDKTTGRLHVQTPGGTTWERPVYK